MVGEKWLLPGHDVISKTRWLIVCTCMLAWFPRTTTIEHHWLGGLNTRHLLSHSSGKQIPKIKMSAGLVHSKDCKENICPGFSPYLVVVYLLLHFYIIFALHLSLHPKLPFL